MRLAARAKLHHARLLLVVDWLLLGLLVVLRVLVLLLRHHSFHLQLLSLCVVLARLILQLHVLLLLYMSLLGSLLGLGHQTLVVGRHLHLLQRVLLVLAGHV